MLSKIYHTFDRETGKHLGWDYATHSPREPGKFLLPAFATWKRPPLSEKGKEIFFINGEWRQIEIGKPASRWDKVKAFFKRQTR